MIQKDVHKLKEHVEWSICNIFCIGTHDLQNNSQLVQDNELAGSRTNLGNVKLVNSCKFCDVLHVTERENDGFDMGMYCGACSDKERMVCSNNSKVTF